MKNFICLLLGCILSACTNMAITSATPTVSQIFDSATPDISTPTLAITTTPRPSRTPVLPTPTKVVRESQEALLTNQAEDAQATKIAVFSVNCKDSSSYTSLLSPDENWLAIHCGYKRDQTLEIVNREGKRWILEFKTYLPKEFAAAPEDIPMGGLFPIYWSNDSGYLYFAPYIAYDGGGTCFYGYGVHGLLRIKLDNGNISTILPVTTSFIGYYITFSPTGRRLAYGSGGDLAILDLQTGDKVKVNVDNQSTGAFTWSPDGLQLAYSTCKAKPDYSVDESAIRIYSTQTNSSRTIIEIEGSMFYITHWDTNNIMKIILDSYYDDRNEQLFDLSSNQWITPTPKP